MRDDIHKRIKQGEQREHINPQQLFSTKKESLHAKRKLHPISIANEWEDIRLSQVKKKMQRLEQARRSAAVEGTQEQATLR